MITSGTERSGAIFSSCRTWRYQLWRRWSNAPLLVMIGLNPSTADETHNDPTITRCLGFAQRERSGGLLMLNLFAFRATSPHTLKGAQDPIGPENDAMIRAICQDTAQIIVAWGNHGGLGDRDRTVTNLLRATPTCIHCFGLTKQGYPRHPLYLKKNTQLVHWHP